MEPTVWNVWMDSFHQEMSVKFVKLIVITVNLQLSVWNVHMGLDLQNLMIVLNVHRIVTNAQETQLLNALNVWLDSSWVIMKRV